MKEFSVQSYDALMKEVGKQMDTEKNKKFKADIRQMEFRFFSKASV